MSIMLLAKRRAAWVFIATLCVLVACLLFPAPGDALVHPESGASVEEGKQDQVHQPTPVAGPSEREKIAVDEPRDDPLGGSAPTKPPVVERRLLGRVESPSGEIVASPQPVVVVFRSGNLAAERHEVLAAGTFELPVPRGAEVVLLSGLGNARQSAVLSPQGDSEVVLRLGSLVYCLGQVVSGADGSPLAIASLVACTGIGEPAVRVCSVDEEGRFELWLPENTLLTASAAGYTPARGVFVTTRHRADPLVLACQLATEVLTAQVSDSSGSPIAGARLYAGRRWPAVQYDHERLESHWSLSAVIEETDAAGLCRLPGDWSSYNSIQVVCKKPGMATKLLTVSRKHVGAADQPLVPDQLVEINMDAGTPLIGHVQDKDGKPITGIRVWLSYGTFAETYARTNNRGEFAIEQCDLGSSLEILIDSRPWEKRVVAVGGEFDSGQVTIVLEPTR